MRFSPSRISTWMSCPLKAKFHYIDHLPGRQNAKASFGTIIHHCLEGYEQHLDIDRAVAEFKDNWENPEKLGVTPEVWPKFTSFATLAKKGPEILRDYHDRNRVAPRQILGLEHRFLVPFGDHELTGIVDKLEIRQSGKGKNLIRIVDYKTGKKPLVSELAMNIQFTIYEYASHQKEFWVGNGPDFPGIENGEWLWEMHKETPRRLIWHALMTYAEMDAGSRDETDYERVHRACIEIDRAIEHEVYVPNISGESCGICDYTEPCGVTIPTPVELRNQDNAWI